MAGRVPTRGGAMSPEKVAEILISEVERQNSGFSLPDLTISGSPIDRPMHHRTLQRFAQFGRFSPPSDSPPMDGLKGLSPGGSTTCALHMCNNGCDLSGDPVKTLWLKAG